METSKTLGKIFAEHKLIDSKGNHLIWKVLCSSNFSTKTPNFQNNKMRKKLLCCDNIEAEIFRFKNWHQPIVLKFNLNCETPSLTYLIICSGCNKEYIGQTRVQLKERLTIYRQHIRQPEYEKIEVEMHLRTCANRIFPSSKWKKIKSSENATNIISLKSLNRN